MKAIEETIKKLHTECIQQILFRQKKIDEEIDSVKLLISELIKTPEDARKNDKRILMFYKMWFSLRELQIREVLQAGQLILNLKNYSHGK